LCVESTRDFGQRDLDGLRDAVVWTTAASTAPAATTRPASGSVQRQIGCPKACPTCWWEWDAGALQIPGWGSPRRGSRYRGPKLSWNRSEGHARAAVAGSHFFQNLTFFPGGYFTVNPEVGEGYVDWDWLAKQPAVEEATYARHLRFESPLVVKMSGKSQQGVILKPTCIKPAS